MFDTSKVNPCLKELIGWKDHYDDTEIPNISNPSLRTSVSGEFYQDKHPALQLNLIQATIPSNKDLEEYLQEKEDAAIVAMLNDITNKKLLSETSKSIVQNNVILDSTGYLNDKIINQSRFVGVRFKVENMIGIRAVINRFAIQLTTLQASPGLFFYLFHSHRNDALATFTVQNNIPNNFTWKDVDFALDANSQEISGGYWYFGYYQDDMVGQAVNYDKLNWSTGYCGHCDGGRKQKVFRSINKYVSMESFYVPAPSLSGTKTELFDASAAILSPNTNWGLNFNISVACDLTSFWCDNRLSLKDLLALKVTQLILNDMKFSQQLNYIEEQLKIMIIRDLEGDKETNYINIPDKYERALNAVHLNHSSMNSVCLPCARNSGVTYGMF